MKLFIPGPVDVSDDTLEVLKTKQISHRSQQITNLQYEIEKYLQKVFSSKSRMVLSTSSGTGGMEMSIRSLTLKKVACFSVGAFGDRFYEIAVSNGIDATLFKSEEGKAIDLKQFEETLKSGLYDTITITHNETSTGIENDLETLSEIYKKYPDIVVIVDTITSFGGVDIPLDKWGIDASVTATQKALALPPGLSIISVSDKAYKRMCEVGHKGYYLDLKRVYEMHIKNGQYPSTPNTALMHALLYKLKQIVDIEGIENRFKRHRELASYTRTWAEAHFKLFADQNHLSQTVTTVSYPKAMDINKLKSHLKDKGYVFSTGYGELSSHTFRIAHMGDLTLADLDEYLKEITDYVQNLV
jgi:aspartate aminotransferase-like enzyme